MATAERIYITPFIGDGTDENEFRSPINGIRGHQMRDFRTDKKKVDGTQIWLFETTDAQHAAALAMRGVIYLGEVGQPIDRTKAGTELMKLGVNTDNLKTDAKAEDLYKEIYPEGEANWKRAKQTRKTREEQAKLATSGKG